MADWKDDYVLRHKSTWRWIYTCTSCGDHTDSDEHRDVCPQCGHQQFTRAIGRWHAYHRNLSFWRELAIDLFFKPIPPVRFDVEFKDPTHDA